MARTGTRRAGRKSVALTVLMLGTAVAALDQISKAWALATLVPYRPVEFWPPLVNFVLVFNKSAAFSIGADQTWIFTIVSSLAAIALLATIRKIESLSWALLSGLLLGGVVGNLVDRLTREPALGFGQVVDFIQIPLNFPIFNVADIAISAVAVVTIIRLFRGDRIGKARGAARSGRGGKR